MMYLKCRISSRSHPPWIFEGNVRGLDVGCGANCIYPLLGATALGWEFVGVDNSKKAVCWANLNVKKNNEIAQLISVRELPQASLNCC